MAFELGKGKFTREELDAMIHKNKRRMEEFKKDDYVFMITDVMEMLERCFRRGINEGLLIEEEFPGDPKNREWRWQQVIRNTFGKSSFKVKNAKNEKET